MARTFRNKRTGRFIVSTKRGRITNLTRSQAGTITRSMKNVRRARRVLRK